MLLMVIVTRVVCGRCLKCVSPSSSVVGDGGGVAGLRALPLPFILGRPGESMSHFRALINDGVNSVRLDGIMLSN